MKKYLDSAALLLTSVWVGGMWVVGYVVAPILFQSLPDKVLAGLLAGKLFAAIAYIGMACGIYLLGYYFALYGRQVSGMTAFRVLVLMLLLTLIGQFLLQPMMADLKQLALPQSVMESPLAERFRLLHGTASLVFLLQSVLGALLLLKRPSDTA